MKYLKFNIVFILIFLLSGCSAMHNINKYDEYKNAPAHDKHIVLPKDINIATTENHYVLPKTTNSTHSNASVLPPGAKIKE